MRVAILADQKDGFAKPMAAGLERMLLRVGADTDLIENGLEMLEAMPIRPDQTVGRGIGEAGMATVRHLLRSVPAYRRFLSRIRACHLVVVVDSIPHAFLRGALKVEYLRSLFPQKPVVLYDVFFLSTRGPWAKWIREGNPERRLPAGGFGLERFDWYLVASVVSEVPLPREPQPLSIVGLDLDDGTLYPGAKDPFTALLDFEHPPDMRERAIQIEACEEAGVPYAVLNGPYSMESIRAIYRKTSAYFLAMRESFGLPICELQACGSYVFTPYSRWAPSHWLKRDASIPGPGALSSNFIVYKNDKERLKQELLRIRASFEANQVVDTFRAVHPQYFHGDDEALGRFLARVASGEIHSGKHREHTGLLSTVLRQDFPRW